MKKEIGPGTKLFIPKGYKTWFYIGEPPVAIFAQGTEVEIDTELNDYW